ncbi:hypothetical protein B0H14DRAFT_2934931 [Mycena olivaceomarginata]|nr:hypothetical protein B0H14DRAFT_2934931 [Mycena olivaceomarginata]
MQLTPEVLPVLSSKRLFVHSDLSAVSPAVHPTLKALRTELKRIKKAFKKGAGAEASLLAWRTALDRVRTLWTAHTGVWCALDFETWTENHSIVTEFGFSAVHWTEDEQKTDTGHFTVEEHRFHRNGRTYPNGKHVPEYREHYNAEFGTSVEVTKAVLESTVGNLISGMHARGPVFLVFHDAHEDIKTLNRLGAPIDGAVDVGQLPPDTIPTQGIYIVDTTILFGALIGDCKNKKGLRDVCAFLQIPTRYLHNAGNDAHYTLDALQAMASGRPLDA